MEHPDPEEPLPSNGQNIILAIVVFTRFGIGPRFHATPSTSDALYNVAAAIYKVASSLGNAIGVAGSAALYVANQAMDPTPSNPGASSSATRRTQASASAAMINSVHGGGNHRHHAQ